MKFALKRDMHLQLARHGRMRRRRLLRAPDPAVDLRVDVANYWLDPLVGPSADLSALLAFARGFGRLVKASAYTTNTGSDRDRALLLKLKHLGYDCTRSRPLHTRPDGRRKCDADVTLVMDVWEAAIRRQLDTLVLVSGDGDFVPLVHGLTNRGIDVWVVGPDRSTAPDLILASSHFLNASDVPGFVRRTQGDADRAPSSHAHMKAQREPATVPA